MLEGGADGAEHEGEKDGGHDEIQHLLARVLVSLMTLGRQRWVHKSWRDHLRGQEGPEEWLEEVIVLLSFYLSNFFEPAEDSDLGEAQAEADTGDEGETGCHNIILVEMCLDLQFRECGEYQGEPNQCNRQHSRILSKGHFRHADVLKELLMVTSINHPKLNTNRQDGWSDPAKYNQDDVAHVSDINHLKSLHKQADSDSQSDCDVEESPSVSARHLQNIVL